MKLHKYAWIFIEINLSARYTHRRCLAMPTIDFKIPNYQNGANGESNVKSTNGRDMWKKEEVEYT
jgi:hypothetical protein